MMCMAFTDRLSRFLIHKSGFRHSNQKSRVPRTLSESQTDHKIAHESLYQSDQIFWILWLPAYCPQPRRIPVTGIFESKNFELELSVLPQQGSMKRKMNVRNGTTLRTHDSAKCDWKCLIVQLIIASFAEC